MYILGNNNLSFYYSQNFLFSFFPADNLDPILPMNLLTDCFRGNIQNLLNCFVDISKFEKAQTKHAFSISDFHSLPCYHVSPVWKWFWKLTWRNNLFKISSVHCISLAFVIFPSLSWPIETLKAQKKSDSLPEHFHNKIKYQVLYFICLLVVVNVGYQTDLI